MPEDFDPARQPELDEEVAASIIIQAAYRGHLVRMARRKESVEVCVVQLTLNRNVFELITGSKFTSLIHAHFLTDLASHKVL